MKNIPHHYVLIDANGVDDEEYSSFPAFTRNWDDFSGF